jgi:RNA polymerase sigma factor (sigma-70 family)
MEATTLRQASVPARPAPGPLLRLASDERLITLIRRGHHAAFEALVQRYQSRLLAFCRHMLGSREDAEDVLQDVFAAAFNAILADDRTINVRPWLYRIARNRSLNHLRRATAVGMDSMDTYFADHGQSVPERILQRESFQALVDDIGHLAETQRTALLLREIDALSYEQIAEVMDTTVPSVKSLLVRARVALAEAAEARQLSCEEVREELGEAAEGLVRISPPVRRHVRNCERCRAFSKQLKRNERALAALLPIGGIPALLHRLLATKLGSTGAGGAYAASGGGAGAGASAGAGAGLAAGAGAASGLGGVSGLASVGGGAVAAKAMAGLAAAALLTAGAVEVDHSAPRTHAPRGPVASASVYSAHDAPAVVSSVPQALTVSHASASVASKPLPSSAHAARSKHHSHTGAAKTASAGNAKNASSTADAASVHNSKTHDASAAADLLRVTPATSEAPSAGPSAAVTPAPAAPASSTSAPSEEQATGGTGAGGGPTGPTGPDEAAGPTGPSGPDGPTGEAGATPPTQPPAAPTGTTEATTGGAQAPPAASEAPAAG